MDYIKGTARAAAIILFGGVLYVGLNWVPIAGPLAVGFIVGWLRKGTPKECFKTGIYAGVLGFITVSLLFSWWRLNTPSNDTLFSLLSAWIILLWNILGILLSGLGGALAGLFRFFNRFLGWEAAPSEPRCKTTVSYRICETCGSGLIKDSGECTICRGKQWVP